MGMISNIYLDLTRQFNRNRLRAVLAGGQATVLHRLAMMSKDGDWILREDKETFRHVLSVLEEYGARYRFCAPLDIRWMRGGWSSHFEFAWRGLRVRTDFFTRPPRLGPADLTRLWSDQSGSDIPYAGAQDLAEMKKTAREKDYAVIGELARLIPDVDGQILLSRSARDLMRFKDEHPSKFRQLIRSRPALRAAGAGMAALEVALDAERRDLMHADEKRLGLFSAAAASWATIWPEVEKEIAGRPLTKAHSIVLRRAADCLPEAVRGS